MSFKGNSFMVNIPISWGELFDKIVILQIKKCNITNEAKLHNVNKELSILTSIVQDSIEMNHNLEELILKLKNINNSLWDVEDQIRKKEMLKEFDNEFISLARSVYKKNDERAYIKREINQVLGSPLIEEKSYQSY